MTAIRPTVGFLLRHPAHFVALGFGAGLAPRAPGTFGTLVAIPLAFVLQAYTGDAGFIAIPNATKHNPNYGFAGLQTSEGISLLTLGPDSFFRITGKQTSNLTGVLVVSMSANSVFKVAGNALSDGTGSSSTTPLVSMPLPMEANASFRRRWASGVSGMKEDPYVPSTWSAVMPKLFNAARFARMNLESSPSWT